MSEVQNFLQTQLSQGAEMVTKWAAVIGGLAYFSGLIITNIFMAEKGFFLIQLLKADYILIGGLWLFLLFIAFVWIGSIIDIFREKDPDETIIDRIVTSFAFLIGYVLCVALVSVFSVDEVTGLDDLHLLYVLGVFGGQAISIHMGLWIINKWREQKDLTKGLYPLLSIFSVVIVTIFLSSYYRYALDIYPLYPRIIGGGKPAKAVMSFREEIVNGVESLGIDIDRNGLSPELQMIYENADAYFVLYEKSGKVYSLRLNNSDVVSVRYLPTDMDYSQSGPDQP
jgi:hypothetical protein